MKTSLFLGTALTALLVTGMASAAKSTYHSEPVGDNEVKDDGTAAPTGSALAPNADFTVDTVARTVCGVVEFTATPSGDSAVTAMHFHSGAEKKNGPVLLALPTPTEKSNKIHLKNVPQETIDAIVADPVYLNLHTAAFMAGAARDQLQENNDGAEQPCEGEGTDLGGGGTDAGASSSSSSSSGSTTSDAGKTGTSATPAATDDGGGCNTSGSSDMGSGLAMIAGLGLVIAAASRKRNKKA